MKQFDQRRRIMVRIPNAKTGDKASQMGRLF
jgi:hypothetical protein